MERLTRSRYRKRNQAKLEHESPSFKIAKNEDQIKDTVQFDRMCEDFNKLFKHFPEEIWILITSKLEDPNSLANLMQASLVFRNLLLARRVEFLFPQVWKVLGVKFETEKDEVYAYNIDEMYPDRDRSRFKFKKTPWCSRVLTLRLVCKSWSRGVDEFYENLPENCTDNHYRMMEDREIEVVKRNQGNVDQCWSVWTYKASCFNSGQTQIENFMEHFDTTHFGGDNQKNPIIGRHIWISTQNSNRENGIFPLLSKYGQHIWFCELHFEEDFSTSIKTYKELTDILRLLPNLKTLKLIYNPDYLQCGSYTDVDLKHKSTSKKEILQLKRRTASNPLPKLRDLEFLSVHDIPSCIFNLLVTRNNHISMLEVTVDVIHEGYDIYTFPMPNLKQLSMTYCSKKEFENLNKPQVNWSLEKIYLGLKLCPLFPLSEIFSLLEINWSETLREVFIDTGNLHKDYRPKKVINDGLTTTLNLPNIQRLRFVSKEFFSLDFILPLKKLEFLEVALYSENKFSKAIVAGLRLIESNQVVQFVGYFQRFHQSNIWNLFPNLKSFELQEEHDKPFENSLRNIYTRQEFESAAGGHIEPTKNQNLWLTSSSSR